MPAVLVHGVPETPAIWDGLRARLARDDVIALQLPGFGCPRPDGWGATKEEYVGWLVGELVGIGEPIDLVGHDWGGGFVVRVVSTRPGLVRSWATDAAGIGDPDFEWHAFAKIWQTPGEGEQFMEQQLANRGAPGPMEHLDETMAGCILDLYRSAVDVGKEWGPEFVDLADPGLVLVPTADPFLDAEGARSSARRAGARVVELEGRGHWWMTEDSAQGAAVLEDFWASVG